MVQNTMSGLTGGLSPILLSSVPVLVPVVDDPAHLQWLAGWLVSAGLVGMGLRDLIGGEEEAEEEIAADEDFLGGDLGESMDDDFDGFDDGLGDDDDPLAEVEPRLDDFEAELSDLASTVSAVRGEHESMRQSVDEIEENVRKLLEVYEVVTQGVNPFVDGGAERAPSGGGFGLLDGGSRPRDESGDDEATGGLFEAEGGESTAAETGTETDATSKSTPTEDRVEASEDEGLTFEDLKSEFEFVDEADADPEVPSADPQPDEIRADASVGTRADRPPSPEERPARSDDRGAKPYLTDLPGGFGAELLVMEWLNFLVSESSVADAMRAIRYYQAVDWIGDGVAAHLQTVLSGTIPSPTRAATDGGMPTDLTVDHHTRSLEYISRLQGLDGQLTRRSPTGRGGHDHRRWRGDRGVQR